MQVAYSSDPENPWHFFVRGGHTSLGDSSTGLNMLFFGRGGQAAWGQQCGIATAAMIFLQMHESGNDTYVADFMKHFENGKFPTPWSVEVYNQLKTEGRVYSGSTWGERGTYYFSRDSFMCHGIREKARQIESSIGGICAQASIAAAVEFVLRYLNHKKAGGPAVPSELAGFQTQVGSTCTVSGCHNPISSYAKSNCRVCHK